MKFFSRGLRVGGAERSGTGGEAWRVWREGRSVFVCVWGCIIPTGAGPVSGEFERTRPWRIPPEPTVVLIGRGGRGDLVFVLFYFLVILKSVKRPGASGLFSARLVTILCSVRLGFQRSGSEVDCSAGSHSAWCSTKAVPGEAAQYQFSPPSHWN